MFKRVDEKAVFKRVDEKIVAAYPSAIPFTDDTICRRYRIYPRHIRLQRLSYLMGIQQL